MAAKLCLGTVQFGMNYGINNKSGKPDLKDVFTMLDYAWDQGIRIFDTAMAYGDAEDILGQYITARGYSNEIRVISKLKPNLISDDCLNAEEIVLGEVEGSLKRLKLQRLEGYLLHTPTNFYNPSIINGLKACREKGLVENIGVSIYETQHALDVVSSGIVNYIQVPYSVFDQRLNPTEFFRIAKENNVTVFGRSAFLQGLILMEDEDIPDHLAIARKYLREFDEIIRKYELGRAKAAFLFSYLNPGVDYVVFGVDNINHLVEDMNFANEGTSYYEACMEELKNKFVNIEESIIFPSLWARK